MNMLPVIFNVANVVKLLIVMYNFALAKCQMNFALLCAMFYSYENENVLFFKLIVLC